MVCNPPPEATVTTMICCKCFRPFLRAFWGAQALLLALPALAGGISFGLLPPPNPVAREAAVLQVVALNGGAETAALTIPAHWPGTLQCAGRTHKVEIVALAQNSVAIEPGRFALFALSCPIPPGIDGPVVVTVLPPSGPELQAVFVLPAPDTAITRVSSRATLPGRHPLEPSSPDSFFHRYFAERFGPHEPVYFIYGADDPVAKLQFSLKYRLLDFGRNDGPQRRKTLQFGYTQRSLWDIKGPSSPFYDTSYMPELFFESIAPPVEEAGGRYHGLGLQTGFLHESNGRDGLDSRSLNQFFFRPFFLVGAPDRWHAIVAPELILHVGAMDANPRLRNYRGYGRLRFALGYGDGPSLTVVGYCGRDFGHPTVQLDLAVPLHFALFDFKTFLLVQYFDGYGESLLDYQEHSRTVRAGMALVR